MTSLARSRSTLCQVSGLVFAILLSSCGEKVEYFRRINLNGKFQYTGIFPVNKAEVASNNCYKFTSFGGRLESIEFLKNGRLSLSDFGFARLVYEYYENVVMVSWEDQFALPMRIENTHTYERLHITKEGVYDQLDFLDRNFHPVIVDGIRFVNLESDNKGRRATSWYHGPDGKLTEKEGVYGIKRKFNDEDMIVEQMFLDRNGNPGSDIRGLTYMRSVFDPSGNHVTLSYLDIDDKPVESLDGVATTRWKYDKFGNTIETAYYDRFDNIVNGIQGIAFNTFTYDLAGNQISRAFFDSLMRPAPFEGFVKFNWFYDKQGFCTRQAFFREKDDSVYLDYSIRFIYDESGNLREERRYGSSMKLEEENGIAVRFFGYDGAHNMVSYQTYDAEGYLVPFEKGIADIKWSYNISGEKIECRYYDPDGNLKGGKYHEAINRSVYDECGFLLEQSLYDSLDQPMNFNGVSRVEFSYDDFGRLVEELKFDKDGTRIESPLFTQSL